MLAYDDLTPFRQIIHRTRRKQELRAILRTAFDVGGGLAGVDSWLIHMYLLGELHFTRQAALERRLADDPEFRAYAIPHIEYGNDMRFRTNEERAERFKEFRDLYERLPKSPRDRREDAWIAHSIILMNIKTVRDEPPDEGDDGEEYQWPTGESLDIDLNEELTEEQAEPLDAWEPRDLLDEAYEYAVSCYVDGWLEPAERRVVLARTLADEAFRERWGDAILAKLEKRIMARERRRRRGS